MSDTIFGRPVVMIELGAIVPEGVEFHPVTMAEASRRLACAIAAEHVSSNWIEFEDHQRMVVTNGRIRVEYERVDGQWVEVSTVDSEENQ